MLYMYLFLISNQLSNTHSSSIWIHFVMKNTVDHDQLASSSQLIWIHSVLIIQFYFENGALYLYKVENVIYT